MRKPLLMHRARGLWGSNFGKHANHTRTLSKSAGTQIGLGISGKLRPVAGWTIAVNCELASVEGTGTLAAASTNSYIGKASGIDSNPASIDGHQIRYLGSNGSQFWKCELGVGANERIANSNSLTVTLAGSMVTTLNWNDANNEYRGGGLEDIADLLLPQRGNVVPFTIRANI